MVKSTIIVQKDKTSISVTFSRHILLFQSYFYSDNMATTYSTQKKNQLNNVVNLFIYLPFSYKFKEYT